MRKWFSKLVAVGISLSALSAPAAALDIWHSDTIWGGQGICVATFTLDSGGDSISRLSIGITASDRKGESVGAFVLEVPDFGASNAERYATATWESEAACEEDLTLSITAAHAVIDNQRINLLKESRLTTRDFKPFKIQLK